MTMQIVFSVFFFLSCVLSTIVLTRRVTGQISPTLPMLKVLISITLFSSVFLVSYFILGFLNLIFELEVVRIEFSFVVSLFVLAASYVVNRQFLPNEIASQMELERERLSVLSKSLLTAAVVTFLLAMAFTMAGFPQGWESSAYHLPLAIHFLQTNSLELWDKVGIHTNYANSSIYYAFLLNFLPEKIVSGAAFVYLLILSSAIYGISRIIGSDKTSSIIAALGILTIPMVSFASVNLSSDVGGVAFLAVSLYFALIIDVRSRYLPILSGLAAGIAIGLKALHLIPAAFITIVFFANGYMYSEKRLMGRFWDALRPSGSFLLALLFITSYWWVRNFSEFGNPLYPIYVEPVFDLLGWPKAFDTNPDHFLDVQQYWVSSSWAWLTYPWVEWHYGGHFYNANSGVGAFFSALVPPAFLSAVYVGRTVRSERRMALLYLVGGAVFLLFAWFVLNNRQPKYALGSIVFLIPLVAWSISLTVGKIRSLYLALGSSLIILMLLVFFSKTVIFFGDHIIYSKQTDRHTFYGYPKTVDRLPAGSVVANLYDRRHNFILTGATHENKVISFLKTIRTLGDDVPMFFDVGVNDVENGFELSAARLSELGATHIYVAGMPRMNIGDKVILKELERVTINPVNGLPRKISGYLYKIDY